MEVVLKKTKITSTILKQAQRSTSIDMKVGVVLGWCFFNKLKQIIIYRTDTNELSIYPLFTDVEFGEKFAPSDGFSNTNVEYWVKVRFGGAHIPISYTCRNEDETEDFIRSLKLIKNKALEKGQVFI